MNAMNSILRTFSPLMLCLFLSVMTACANTQNIQACNRMSYEQAPPVYEHATMLELNRCANGMATPGLQSHQLGLAANPFFCEQWAQQRDINYDARRAIFEACTKGQVASNVPAVMSPR